MVELNPAQQSYPSLREMQPNIDAYLINPGNIRILNITTASTYLQTRSSVNLVKRFLVSIVSEVSLLRYTAREYTNFRPDNAATYSLRIHCQTKMLQANAIR